MSSHNENSNSNLFNNFHLSNTAAAPVRLPSLMCTFSHHAYSVCTAHKVHPLKISIIYIWSMIEAFSVWCSSDMSARFGAVSSAYKRKQFERGKQQHWIDTNCLYWGDLHSLPGESILRLRLLQSHTQVASLFSEMWAEQNLNILINGNIEMSPLLGEMSEIVSQNEVL